VVGVASRTEDTQLLVIFFDDMKGSTALKERMAETRDEQAFQALRQEHDALLTEIITRDGAGVVLKTTGDGLLATFTKPSTAVQRALEIQERLHGHPHLSVRIGMDMGEVRIESIDGVRADAFGRHVDWAAHAMSLTDGGHIVITRAVYTDAFSWLTKSQIAWKEHGWYRAKPGEPALEIFEPYNANITPAMPALRGERISGEGRERPSPESQPAAAVRIIRSWESVARDGREFAERGAGMMYWFRPPLGGISYPEGFRSFLQPALENPRITKIRFVLDGASPVISHTWFDLVIPQVEEWANGRGRRFQRVGNEHAGSLLWEAPKALSWIFVDVSREYAPVCKLLVHDPDTDVETESQAQIFLSTAARTVRLKDGSLQTVRIPDVILRVGATGNEALLHALNSVANQWDALFV
jgi:class 3 adenylate cyclase